MKADRPQKELIGFARLLKWLRPTTDVKATLSLANMQLTLTPF